MEVGRCSLNKAGKRFDILVPFQNEQRVDLSPQRVPVADVSEITANQDRKTVAFVDIQCRISKNPARAIKPSLDLPKSSLSLCAGKNFGCNRTTLLA